MNKIIKILIIALVILAVAFLIAYNNFNKKVETICFKEKCFQAEVVSNGQARQRGLMGRESLDQEKGMLFVFDKEDKYSFWMKDTKIPLDLIWMDKNYNIVDIQTLSQCTNDPCPTFAPTANAQFVLEINSGISAKFGIEIGDKAKLTK